LGALVQILGEMQLFAVDKSFFVRIGQVGKSFVRLGPLGSRNLIGTGAITSVDAPTISPAYMGVGYVIGPNLAALQFSGGVLAWGVLVPLFMYFLGPQLQQFLPAGAGATEGDWLGNAAAVWRYIVRPIAVGGMLVGSAYTLIRMGKNLTSSLGRALSEARHGAPPLESVARTERYMGSKTIFGMIAVVFGLMIALYIYFSGNVVAGSGGGHRDVAGRVLLCDGVGKPGGHDRLLQQPHLRIDAFDPDHRRATDGGAWVSQGPGGVAVVLGVAAVVCVSSAVAGELLQDFKVGYILGGTPRTIQMVELIAVVVASLVMYYPLYVLQVANIHSGGTGFGDKALSAPQAGLMAALAQGIVGGEMAWPLVFCGALFGAGTDSAESPKPNVGGGGHVSPTADHFRYLPGRCAARAAGLAFKPGRT
jgi:uncharacterized oligopeptide transporter (OPT) family protein